MALQKNSKNEAECTTQSRPQPNHLFCTKPGGHVRGRIQNCNHSLMSEQRKPGKRGVIPYRWSMFTEIKNHLHTEVVYKCTKSETQQILEAVIMLLIILQHHTRHTKLSRAGTHFGFFIFRNKKKSGQPGPDKITSQCKEVIIRISCHNGQSPDTDKPDIITYLFRCYYGVIFSDFFLCCCHAPEILYFYLITKRASRLFGNGKHLLTLCPGHFISGVTGPEYRWIARLYYRCRNFITNRHTSSLQSAYLRLSHHR